MNDGTGLAEALLELDGFRVLEVSAASDEVVATVESDRTDHSGGPAPGAVAGELQPHAGVTQASWLPGHALPLTLTQPGLVLPRFTVLCQNTHL